MASNKQAGDRGENEVIKLVRCPNCGKSLMLLPPSYPLYDVQCSACSFRAQVKTANKKPTSRIFGAGWDIIDKVTKAGFLMPPLIVNFSWIARGKKHREVRFYPFIPKNSVHRYTLSEKHPRAGYKMFSYRQLDELPHFTLLAH